MLPRRHPRVLTPAVAAAERPAPAPAGARTGRLVAIRRAGSRVPRSLAALLGVVTVLGIAWAMLNPAWQSPDEDIHFSYVQTLSELHRLPGALPGPSLSSAQVDAMQSFNNDPVVFFIGAKPEWSRLAYEDWKRRSAHDKMNDAGGPNAASTYPPAYYLYETLGYDLAGSHSDIFARLYAARLASILFLLVTTVGVWLLAGEIFGRDRLLQLTAAGVIGLWPMVDFMSASVNPDSLLYALWTLALWLGVRIIRRGPTVASAVGFGAAVGLAMITKATTLALLPAALFVLLVAAWRLRPRGSRGRVLAAIVGGLVLFAIPVEAWHLYVQSQHRVGYAQAGVINSGLTGVNLREFLSYVWEYYLPKLPFQHPVRFDAPRLSGYPTENVWIAGSWAAFGWVTVLFPPWVYRVFTAITALVGIGALAYLLPRLRGRLRTREVRTVALPIAIFLGLALVVLVAGLHWNEYKLHRPINQGRYLFPMVGLAGVTAAAALARLPRRWWPRAVGVLFGGLLVFQLLCLGHMAARFYA